jgi:hypothetical protein
MEEREEMQNCISSLLEGIWPRTREKEAVAPAGKEVVRPPERGRRRALVDLGSGHLRQKEVAPLRLKDRYGELERGGVNGSR